MKWWSFGFLVLRHSFCRGITGVRSAPDNNAAFFSGNDRKGLSDLQSSLRAELPLAASSHLWHLSGSWQLQLTAYGFLSYFLAAQPLPNTSISLFSEWTYIASGISFVSVFDSVWDKFFWLAYCVAYCSHRLFDVLCMVHRKTTARCDTVVRGLGGRICHSLHYLDLVQKQRCKSISWSQSLDSHRFDQDWIETVSYRQYCCAHGPRVTLGHAEGCP